MSHLLLPLPRQPESMGTPLTQVGFSSMLLIYQFKRVKRP